ncbi:MAG: response regulator [Deltaproteobacteria bacterium]|nr:MAG: response regulator [Deltaproteobacteria bacterium]
MAAKEISSTGDRFQRLSPKHLVQRCVTEYPTLTACAAAGGLGLLVFARVEVLRAGLPAGDVATRAMLDTIAKSLLLVTAIGALAGAWLTRKLEEAWTDAKRHSLELEQMTAELQREITDRTRAEKALAAANERISANHAQLERWAADLEIAHARLREVDDLKTKFLSEVAHELRSPMAAVFSAAKIIVKHHKTKPEVVERFGQTIMSEGARMTRLINDFLDLAKIESGAIEWNETDVDVAVLVDDAIHGVDALALERDIHIRADIAPDTPNLRADRDRLFRVVTNLLGNAIKFTPRGGDITVRAWREGGNVTVAVDDTGPGIPPEECDRVFDRFHQVCAERNSSGRRTGSGLGLCIAREIVEHYGGRIWVESEVGKGSSFRFSIPTSGAAQHDAVAAREAEDQKSRSARVLVLLDDSRQAERLRAVPDDAGITCRLCEDLDELIAATREWHPDALVVGATQLTAASDRILSLMRENTSTKLLVYSPQHGLTAPSMLDSAEVLVPTLRGRVEQGSLVYVVDDDPDYRGILEFEIGQAGFAVQSFADGEQAIAAIRRQAPSAMVLDLIMPGTDGLTVLERLRPLDVDFPIYVYTGLDDPGVALAAKDLGAAEVFRKDGGGVSYAAVCSRVSRVLGPLLADPDAPSARR